MYLNNQVSRCQLLRLVGDAAGRNVRDEDSCVSLSPNDVEPEPLALGTTQLHCTLHIGFNVNIALWGEGIMLNSKGVDGRWQAVRVYKTYFQS